MATTAHSEAPTVAHDSLAAELLARRRKKLPALTAALTLAVAAATAFIGGAEVQRHWGGSSASSTASTRAAGFRGFGGGGAASAAARLGFGGAGSATSGTVTLIKGSTLYVTAANGNTVLVHTSASSKVTKSVAGTVQTVHPGDSVTVTGAQQTDGSYTASQITIGGGTNG